MINKVTGFKNNNCQNTRGKTSFGTTIKSSNIPPRIKTEATLLEPLAEDSHLSKLFQRFQSGEFKLFPETKLFKSEKTDETLKRGLMAGQVRSIILASSDETHKVTSINVATSPQSEGIINHIFRAFSPTTDKE